MPPRLSGADDRYDVPIVGISAVDSSSLTGTDGKRYRLLPHERHRVQRLHSGKNRRTADKAPAQIDSGPTALALQVAAVANLRMLARIGLCVMAFAFVMAGITGALGHPLSTAHDPGPVAETIIFVVVFWGVVLFGVSTLVMAIVRVIQAKGEGHLYRSRSRALPYS
jgi:hypothetical protein